MYLIYVDDYGNTGSKLDDEDQPLFALSAVLVPEKEWVGLEGQAWNIAGELAKKVGLEPGDLELHAKELFSARNPRYYGASMDDRMQTALALAEAVAQHRGRYVTTYVDKRALALRRKELEGVLAKVFEDELPTGGGREFRVEAEAMTHPYTMAFSALLNELDAILVGLGERGVLIIDRQEQYGDARTLKSHVLLRQSRGAAAGGLLEMPLEGRPESNILLQISDVLGYAIAGSLKQTLYGTLQHARYAPIVEAVRPLLVPKDALGPTQGTVTETVLHMELSARLGGKRIPPSMIENLIAVFADEDLRDKEEGKENPEGLGQS